MTSTSDGPAVSVTRADDGRRRGLWMALVAVAWLVPVPAMAQKTDVVVMNNGDRVTCEIKKLDRGILEASTDSWGTLSIEWEDVDQVSSPMRFEVELQSGLRVFGTLGPAPQSGFVVVDGGAPVTYAISDVVAMKPVGESFWNRLDGEVNIGYSYASAGKATQWSLSSDVVLRRERVDTHLSADSFFSSKEGADDTSRHSVALDVVRYVRPRWGVSILAQAQRNDELLLRLRAQAGGGATYYVLQSNSVRLSVSGGAVYNRELFTDDTPSERSFELVAGSQFEWFLFNTPKTRVTNYLWAFPSLTTSGRVRVELNSSVRREIVKDFFVNLSLVDSYDSQPPSEARQNDVTIVTSLGWSF